MTLFGDLGQADKVQGWGEVGAPKAGATTLDRAPQAMLLFGSRRGEARKRFIIKEGVGKQPQFWKLAQSPPRPTQAAPMRSPGPTSCSHARRGSDSVEG